MRVEKRINNYNRVIQIWQWDQQLSEKIAFFTIFNSFHDILMDQELSEL